MLDIQFYHAGCEGTTAIQRLKAFPRRLLRRILEPIFFQQVELYRNLFDRLYQKECEVDELRDQLFKEIAILRGWNTKLEARMELVDERNETALAMGWDHVAMMRRLAVLEDHVAALTGSSLASSDDPEPIPSILFPGLENVARASAARKLRHASQADGEARSKVC